MGRPDSRGLAVAVLAACLCASAGAAPAKTVAPRKPAAKPAAGRTAAPRPAAAAGAANVIDSVNVQSSGRFAKVVIQSASALRARDVASPDGTSISLYFTETVLCKRPPIEKVDGELVEEVRYGYQGARMPEGKPLPLDSITFKLKEPASYAVSQRDWILQVELKPRNAGPALAAPLAEVPLLAEEDGSPLAPVKSGPLAVLPANPALEDFLQVGLSNHVPLRLADQEYRLSKLRHFEAARGMFPSASGKYESSEGTLLKDVQISTDDIHFIRKEYGLQVGQPLFRSGGLYHAWKQAGMQKKAASQNVKKVRADMMFEIVKAYHNLVKSQRGLKVRKDLMERMDKIIEMTRKKRQLELITEADALGAESQYSQAYYRMLSDEKDLDIARLRLEALLNLPDTLPGVIPDAGETFNPKDVLEMTAPVDAYVDQALKHRPEMLSADYAAAAGAHGEKVARAQGRLQVDASGFIGRAGGAFRDDPQNPFTYKKSWNVGVQAGLFFLGNSVKGTQAKDHSSPDYGETTATDTESVSASVGFLDGLKVIGDRRQARIAREKAYHEREQARRNIEVEVREAYYNIQKAKIQIKGAQQELGYRQKELGISRQKERMNLIEPTQSLQAESAYGDAINSWEEAVAFYRVSLASLEKAVGLPLEQLLSMK